MLILDRACKECFKHLYPCIGADNGQRLLYARWFCYS